MSERLSVTTFVMGERLPWPDDAPVPNESQLDTGVLHDSGSQIDCSIRKISALGATLRGPVRGEPGNDVAFELATGQRSSGTIEWVQGGEAGIVFKQPVDVLALINRTLVSQPIERRIMPRVELRCQVHLKCSGKFVMAMLRNISAQGIQLEGDDLPTTGAYVAVFIEGLNLPAGEIVWRKANLAGVELLEEMSWSSIMPWIRTAIRNGTQ